jgi:hypothetical protein
MTTKKQAVPDTGSFPETAKAWLKVHLDELAT